ncbi:MAG: hypothetical protein LUO98_08830 [Methanoregula sp.]|nr:hypothetical protein [Methanoregula sp.]
MKFGTVVNSEGFLIEVPCIQRECAWFFDNGCAIVTLARELCTTSQKKKSQKGIRAD